VLIDEGASNKMLFLLKRKEKFVGSPAELVTDPSKSNLHEIIGDKNVIVMNGEPLKHCFLKSIFQMLDTGLKAIKSHIL